MLMPSIFGESLFDDFFDGFGGRPARRPYRFDAPAMVPGVMKTDVTESENGYDLAIELPGYKKEDVSATLKEGYMTITATTNKSNDEKDDEGHYLRRERYSGSCSRTFYVGKETKQEDIKAKFEDGILKVFVPKKQPEPKLEENHNIFIEG